MAKYHVRNASRRQPAHVSYPPFIQLASRAKRSRLVTSQVLLGQSSPDDVQIDLDVPRTINRHVLFRRRYRGGSVQPAPVLPPIILPQ